MIKAVLFDLDDTLLGNNIDTFMEGYFGLLGAHASEFMDAQTFIQELLICTQAMMADTNTAVSNRDTFWQAFARRNPGHDVDALEEYFDKFYRHTFPKLQHTTEKRDSARRLVQHCLDHGLKVVVATNPVFPRVAIEHRLAWAGVPVSEYDFDLVTTYENMHSTKPHRAYYEEILSRIDVSPQDVLMVGDDWENDIEPAAALGLYTYWVTETAVPRPDPHVPVTAQGTLDQLAAKVAAGWLEQLTRS